MSLKNSTQFEFDKNLINLEQLKNQNSKDKILSANNTPGKLIVIEGLEGAGKSTAVDVINELLAKQKINTITTREPGGTPIGEVLRDLIKNPKYKHELDNRSELLLFYTARIQLLEQVIKPALQEGIWVIADRFELSTLAYQVGGRMLNQEIIDDLSSFSMQGFQPDLTLYLDIDPEEGMKRIKSRGEFDRIEQQPIDFFRRVHESYLYFIKKSSKIAIIDARLSLPEVQRAIRNEINHFLENYEHA